MQVRQLLLPEEPAALARVQQPAPATSRDTPYVHRAEDTSRRHGQPPAAYLPQSSEARGRGLGYHTPHASSRVASRVHGRVAAACGVRVGRGRPHPRADSKNFLTQLTGRPCADLVFTGCTSSAAATSTTSTPYTVHRKTRVKREVPTHLTTSRRARAWPRRRSCGGRPFASSPPGIAPSVAAAAPARGPRRRQPSAPRARRGFAGS